MYIITKYHCFVGNEKLLLVAVHLDTLFRVLTSVRFVCLFWYYVFVLLMSHSEGIHVQVLGGLAHLLDKMPQSDFCQIVLQYPRQE